MTGRIGTIFGAAAMAGVMATPAVADEDLCLTYSNDRMKSAGIKEYYLAGAHSVIRMKCVDDANETKKTCQMQIVVPPLQEVHNISEVIYSTEADGTVSVEVGKVQSGFYENNQISDPLIGAEQYAVSRKLCELQEAFEKGHEHNPANYKMDKLDTPIERAMAEDKLISVYGENDRFAARGGMNKIEAVPDQFGDVWGTKSQNCIIMSSDSDAICISREYLPPVFKHAPNKEVGVTTTVTQYILPEGGGTVVPVELMSSRKDWGTLPEGVTLDYEIGHKNNMEALGLTKESNDPSLSRNASAIPDAYTLYQK